jgi:uncharacterized membrane protein SirB2
MVLAEWYPQLHLAHVTLVAASASLFALRAGAVIAGARWPLRLLPRIAAMTIDTALLAAGATLWAALGLHPLRDAWLGTKLALLAVYVLLGTMALRRARSPRARLAWSLAALACVGFMVSVARAHDPLGALRALAAP